MALRRWVDRIRQNHALEHATINLLSRRYADAQVMGVSGPAGFTLYSTLTAEEIVPTVRRALEALKGGESGLAVHAHCGTNLVITAGATTVATLLGLGYVPDLLREKEAGRQRSWMGLVERLPQAVLLNAVALVAAMPVARWVQANVTTRAEVGDLEIASFFTDYRGGMNRVRVRTRGRAEREDVRRAEG
ncbi:MAG: hypothetical protein JXC32_04860 [Anaerolineae bacterium]|nr:hypothetical protein [Anaerolineae bacterium]